MFVPVFRPSFCLSLVTLCLSSVSAQHQAVPRFANDTESICRPFGECEPCPHKDVRGRFPYRKSELHRICSQLKEPFCQPFGNRRLLHCLPTPSPDLEHPDVNSNPDNLSRPPAITHPPGSHAVDPYSQHHHADGELLEGETIAWESCGRIVLQERADFWEFVACNLLFVCIALVLFILRSKRMSMIHARQLAARIGLARGYG